MRGADDGFGRVGLGLIHLARWGGVWGDRAGCGG